MALPDDGDLIRAVGFVAIYSAYAEEALDDLLDALSFVEPVTDRLRRTQASQKLKEVKRRVLKLQMPTSPAVVEALNACGALLDARHEILHGRIYAQYGGADILEPGRPQRQKRPVTSIELYDLANQLTTCTGELRRPLIFAIPRARAAWSVT